MTLKIQLPTTPSFCIIAPTEFLDPHAARSHTHLVLAHIVDSDQAYADFYLKMSKRGDFVIMDNGAFELGESYAPDKLIQLARACGAEVIVLPDYPDQPAHVTIDAAVEWIPKFRDAGYGTFFVPQSTKGDLDGWIQSYEWAGNNPDIDIIGMSILNIPNALPNISKAYARVVMSQLLLDRGVFFKDKYHHYLGLNAGPNVEIPSLLQMGVLNSCDSSNPVWCGIRGWQYDQKAFDCMMWKKSGLPPVDFSLPSPTGAVFKQTMNNAIAHNLTMVFDMFTAPALYL